MDIQLFSVAIVGGRLVENTNFTSVCFSALAAHHQKAVQGQIDIIEMLNFDKEPFISEVLSIHKAGGIK